MEGVIANMLKQRYSDEPIAPIGAIGDQGSRLQQYKGAFACCN